MKEKTYIVGSKMYEFLTSKKPSKFDDTPLKPKGVTGGILQYIPNETIDFTKPLTVKEFVDKCDKIHNMVKE